MEKYFKSLLIDRNFEKIKKKFRAELILDKKVVSRCLSSEPGRGSDLLAELSHMMMTLETELSDKFNKMKNLSNDWTK